MGNTKSINKCNYENIQLYIEKREKYGNNNNYDSGVLIHSLNQYDNTNCLITFSLNGQEEERTINTLIRQKQFEVPIIVYGLNNNDIRIVEKYNKLLSFGFTNIYLYVGGLFEWLCLQDIYGDDEFKTTSKELDILKYKPNKNMKLCNSIERKQYYIEDKKDNSLLSNIFGSLF